MGSSTDMQVQTVSEVPLHRSGPGRTEGEWAGPGSTDLGQRPAGLCLQILVDPG